jgi:hypothetical protein
MVSFLSNGVYTFFIIKTKKVFTKCGMILIVIEYKFYSDFYFVTKKRNVWG